MADAQIISEETPQYPFMSSHTDERRQGPDPTLGFAVTHDPSLTGSLNCDPLSHEASSRRSGQTAAPRGHPITKEVHSAARGLQVPVLLHRESQFPIKKFSKGSAGIAQ